MNWKGLLTGKTQRLGDVIRFGNVPTLRNESVAEHSFYVTFYAMAIAHWYSAMHALDAPLFSGFRVAWRALTHDGEECISGDFPRTFKYSDPVLTEHLRLASQDARYQWLKTWCTDKELRTFLMDDNGDQTERYIIKIADYLACVSYVYGEWKRGNTAIVHETELPEGLYSLIRLCGDEFGEIYLEAEKLLVEMYGEETVSNANI